MDLTGENPVTGEKQTIVLPDVLRFVMPAAHAVTILGALGDYGPHKLVQPVLANFEQQLLSQQLKPETSTAPADAAMEAKQRLKQGIIRGAKRMSDEELEGTKKQPAGITGNAAPPEVLEAANG